jgi:hypothetical protein
MFAEFQKQALEFSHMLTLENAQDDLKVPDTDTTAGSAWVWSLAGLTGGTSDDNGGNTLAADAQKQQNGDDDVVFHGTSTNFGAGDADIQGPSLEDATEPCLPPSSTTASPDVPRSVCASEMTASTCFLPWHA